MISGEAVTALLVHRAAEKNGGMTDGITAGTTDATTAGIDVTVMIEDTNKKTLETLNF